MGAWQLHALQGGGSAIVEAALVLAGQDYDRTLHDFDDMGPGYAPLMSYSPLGQVPVLITPEGEALSESAAIILYLAERFPEAQLAPPPGAPERAKFLRWLIFIVASIYPTFTYGDRPGRWFGRRRERRVAAKHRCHGQKTVAARGRRRRGP